MSEGWALAPTRDFLGERKGLAAAASAKRDPRMVRRVRRDADITIIDPAIKKTLRMADLHVRDYSPWEGWQVEGCPTTVILSRRESHGGEWPAGLAQRWAAHCPQDRSTGAAAPGVLMLCLYRS